MSTHNKPRKTLKFDIRMSEQEQFLVREAAQLYRVTPTSFIRDRAVAAAQEVIHEQTRIVLNDEQWEEFCTALDAPPKRIPELYKLLNTPSALEKAAE